MASWPLAKNLLWGLTHDPGEGTLRSRVDNGIAKMRRRGTAVPQGVAGTVILTGAELQTLRAWWRDTLKRGSLPFTWEDPVDDTAVSLRFVTRPTWRLVLGGTVSTRKWSVGLTLEIVP